MSEVVTARGQGIHSTWHIPQPCWKNSMVQIVLNVFLELCGEKKKVLEAHIHLGECEEPQCLSGY